MSKVSYIEYTTVPEYTRPTNVPRLIADTSKFRNTVNLKIQKQDGYFEFFIPRERLTSTSVRIFALWITLPAILIVAIAIIFLKNQTRPIKKLLTLEPFIVVPRVEKLWGPCRPASQRYFN